MEVCSRRLQQVADETAGIEDCKHTSGGVSAAIVNGFGADKEAGAVLSVSGNEGFIVNECQRRSVGFRRVLLALRRMDIVELTACDANVGTKDVERRRRRSACSLWLQDQEHFCPQTCSP